MQFLSFLKMIVAILPLIVQAIQAVEMLFPQSGQGSNKLELVKQVLMGSAELADDMSQGEFEKMWPAIQRIIASVVSLANSSGAFKKE